eukprot:TRINITY_DN24938_c0_g1_i1.p1 TRINITY_DN24938_c0_g1~~TRINITY_DN24938_c0_g1_i1.p1  ORF type:complete len:362 (-),score=35.43 TRINITY_DN24938_c0_g1_i1:1229-2314(-)
MPHVDESDGYMPDCSTVRTPLPEHVARETRSGQSLAAASGVASWHSTQPSIELGAVALDSAPAPLWGMFAREAMRRTSAGSINRIPISVTIPETASTSVASLEQPRGWIGDEAPQRPTECPPEHGPSTSAAPAWLWASYAADAMRQTSFALQSGSDLAERGQMSSWVNVRHDVVSRRASCASISQRLSTVGNEATEHHIHSLHRRHAAGVSVNPPTPPRIIAVGVTGRDASVGASDQMARSADIGTQYGSSMRRTQSPRRRRRRALPKSNAWARAARNAMTEATSHQNSPILGYESLHHMASAPSQTLQPPRDGYGREEHFPPPGLVLNGEVAPAVQNSLLLSTSQLGFPPRIGWLAAAAA